MTRQSGQQRPNCGTCGGSGKVNVDDPQRPGQLKLSTCTACGGTGKA